MSSSTVLKKNDPEDVFKTYVASLFKSFNEQLKRAEKYKMANTLNWLAMSQYTDLQQQQQKWLAHWNQSLFYQNQSQLLH